MAQPGWYPDPQQPGTEVYFDGFQWTPQRRTNGSKRGHRRALIALLAVVVLVGAGLGTWLLWPGDDEPTYTYRGARMAAPEQVLVQAETHLRAAVQARHGASAAHTRCYFVTTPDTSRPGAKTDIDDSLACGPVLFVDGDPGRQYVQVTLTSGAPATGGAVTLTPARELGHAVALPANARVSRPDGKSAPHGAGGLAVPAPPPAATDALVAATLGPVKDPQQLTDARLVGFDTTVRVAAAGTVPRYGRGDGARSAPAGHQLLAFRLTYTGGAVKDYKVSKARLVLGRDEPRSLPRTIGDEWVVAAVPAGTPARLQLANGGYTQSLSLPDGRRGADSLAVLYRKNRGDVISRILSVPVTVTAGGRSTATNLRVNVRRVTLSFWIPSYPDRHATDPKQALLSLSAAFTYPDRPTSSYGLAASLLQLRLPDGTLVRARNVARTGRVLDVFEVPADITKATLVISGSRTLGDNVLTVRQAVEVPISFGPG